MTIVLLAISCDVKTNEEIASVPPTIVEEPPSTEAIPEKNESPQDIYNQYGLEGFIEYVNQYKYFPAVDSENNFATPLLLALKTGNVALAKVFISKGASAEEKDINGLGCIDYALESEKNGAIEYALMISPKNSWNKITKDKFLKIITQCNDYSVLKDSLLDSIHDTPIKNLNFKDKDNKTLLMYVAQCNTDVRTTKYLIDRGADINAKNNNEWTAIMYAARYNPNPAVMEDLILRGADTSPNSVGLTLTMLASCNDNPGVLITLLKYKNEVNDQTNKGKTALMYAYENNKSDELKKILIENGADESIKDDLGKSALMYGWRN